MEYRFDEPDWFSNYSPIFSRNLSVYRDVPSKFIEIGSFEGRSSTWLLDNVLTHPKSHLTCIDPCHAEYGDKFFYNLSSHIESQKCRIMAETSQVALPKLLCEQDRCSYDFVYVDGDHHSEAVLRDAVMAFPLVKVGGIIAFDDYNWSKPHLGSWWSTIGVWRPSLAIDSFLAVYGGALETLERGYQLWVRKTRNFPEPLEEKID
jgi:hypothetical protein